MGYVLGLAAGGFFAAGTILVRVGQRHRKTDDGMFMTVLVNTLVLGLVASTATAPVWNAPGIAALVAGGMLGTVGGRFFNLRAVRLIGPSRANAFITGTPAVAAITGWIVLQERLTVLEGLGGMIVITGLLWLVKGRTGGSTAEMDGGATPLTHYLVAAAAPTFFGTAFVVRKWGLERYPSSVIGALLGAASAFALIVAIDMARGRTSDVARVNLRNVPWWFVGAGVATSAALLCQFTAFSYLPAWVVGILQSTQGLWTIAMSYLLLRGDERIDRNVVGSVILVVSGVALISLQL